MIKETIELLRSNEFYGGGEYTEIAKGKNQLVTDWKGFKRKIKRLWQSRKR